jgi:hypothetical protein
VAMMSLTNRLIWCAILGQRNTRMH